MKLHPAIVEDVNRQLDANIKAEAEGGPTTSVVLPPVSLHSEFERALVSVMGGTSRACFYVLTHDGGYLRVDVQRLAEPAPINRIEIGIGPEGFTLEAPPVMDQQDTGASVGHAVAHAAGMMPAGAAPKPQALYTVARTLERDPPEFHRASGNAVCGTCLKPYYKHPYAREPECLDGEGHPFLHRLCDGTLVKL